jgi:hypothetical protein
MVSQHFASDAPNHETFEDATGLPFEDMSNGSYLGPQTVYPDKKQLQVANDMNDMDTQMNTCMLVMHLSISLLNYHYIR